MISYIPQLLYIMIQRSLLRNAAAISRPLRSFPRSSSSPSLAFSPARTVSSSLPQRTAATLRWYSTPVKPDGKANTKSATSQPQTDGEEEEEEEAEEELSSLEKDLETKEREIIDLKVGPLPLPEKETYFLEVPSLCARDALTK